MTTNDNLTPGRYVHRQVVSVGEIDGRLFVAPEGNDELAVPIDAIKGSLRREGSTAAEDGYVRISLGTAQRVLKLITHPGSHSDGLRHAIQAAGYADPWKESGAPKALLKPKWSQRIDGSWDWFNGYNFATIVPNATGIAWLAHVPTDHLNVIGAEGPFEGQEETLELAKAAAEEAFCRFGDALQAWTRALGYPKEV